MQILSFHAASKNVNYWALLTAFPDQVSRWLQERYY